MEPISTTTAAIMAAGSIAGAGVNAGMTGRMNKKSMRFSREMYERQRRDAISNWHMQNEYNSPAAQMKRFQEAGLNPALIYGQQNTAQPIPSTDSPTPEFRTPEFGNALQAGAGSFAQIADLQMKQAQTANLEAQNSVLVQEGLLKLAQTAATIAGTERTEFDLDFAKEMRQTSGDTMREALRQMQVVTDTTINRDVREALINTSNIAEALERIETSKLNRLATKQAMAKTAEEIKSIQLERARTRENIELLKQQNTLNKLDIDLRKAGINPNDPTYLRVLGRFLSKATDPNTKVTEWGGRVLNWLGLR